ncbi:MAG: class I SAM-dependent methyltransferase [bacterium]|nr:class I SAM-dependent methyltransferase [bacterium]
MENIYENMYRAGANVFQNNPRIKIMSGIINQLDLKDKDVLDIGCHEGYLLSLIENKNNNFYGLDASNYAVEESFKKGIKVKKFYFDGKSEIPFSGNSFDLINAGDIIEHIYDTDFFLEEIRRLLRPNGYFLISTPNVASFGRRILLLLSINPFIETSPNEAESSGHIRYFTFKTLKRILEKHSFKIILKKSDVLNLSNDGRFRCFLLPKLFLSLGQSIIYLCQKN